MVYKQFHHPHHLYSFHAKQRDKLIVKELEKEWETKWEVFPELSDNYREPATVPLTNPSTTHKGTSSTTHCSTSLITLTTISHSHPQTSSYSNTTTSNNTLRLAQTTLSTTHTTISTTTTFFFETVTFPKQPPSKKKNSFKKSACITIPKRCLPSLEIFPSRDFQLKHHKKYNLPFRQFQTSLTTAPTPNSKSSTAICTTAAAKPQPKSGISPLTSLKSTPKHFTSVNDKHRFSKK